MPPERERLYGGGMDAESIDRLLEEVGFGVLSLAQDGRPYGLPLSFGFDGGDRLFFVFVGHSEEGRKVSYAEDAAWASFLVYDVTDAAEWRSVVVEGQFDRIGPTEWDRAREAMADNAFRPDLLIDVDRNQDPRVWALAVEQRTGRQVGL